MDSAGAQLLLPFWGAGHRGAEGRGAGLCRGQAPPGEFFRPCPSLCHGGETAEAAVRAVSKTVENEPEENVYFSTYFPESEEPAASETVVTIPDHEKEEVAVPDIPQKDTDTEEPDNGENIETVSYTHLKIPELKVWRI